MQTQNLRGSQKTKKVTLKLTKIDYNSTKQFFQYKAHMINFFDEFGLCLQGERKTYPAIYPLILGKHNGANFVSVQHCICK